MKESHISLKDADEAAHPHMKDWQRSNISPAMKDDARSHWPATDIAHMKDTIGLLIRTMKDKLFLLIRTIGHNQINFCTIIKSIFDAHILVSILD